ncbi:PREDICTED: von Willebrand factor A domain-containing protein 5A-like [Nanorana parkeri]|uniref:von Willebrand factor A domain-containing protein 5A-like n=1 Tax=Nanorana parkeri TaxID=125878 RepID=UPI000854B423|nr:PREDICTED: von Willebrand factor A domain-containing protein 5A-like [Nanorana parkeri]
MPPFPPCCGLIIVASRQPVPLQGISVDVQVKGFVVDVSATLKYKNKEEKAVEAVFIFPMDEDSAVYSFEATTEGKTIVADLQEKEQAHKTYDEAISRGEQAFLLEEDESSADIFSCSVGNLPPGQEAEITLKYVRELPLEADGAVRFVLPAVLNPRYTPKGANSLFQWSIMAESVAMMNFYPNFPAGQEQTNCGEFIFLVDRSGSMERSMYSETDREFPQRIQSAKETLLLLLKSLPLGCYFNIYGFGSYFEAFFPESVEYTQQSMEESVKMVNEMDACFGGTEILQPLKKIYQTAGRAEHPRQLFVFTDGEVGNTKQVIDEVQKNAQKHRCFAFGIGEGASTSLIKGMARAGNGTFEFITGKDRMQPKVLRALKWSLQPTVKDVSLTWTLPSGVEAIVLSKVPTTIFQGQRSIVYAQLKGKVENEGEVCLQYKFKDEVVKNDIRFPLNVQSAERPTIHRLAAKALISELEHGTESQSEEVKKKILETSLQSGVVSSLTAYVAINKDTKTRVEGPPVRIEVPAPAFMMMGSPNLMHRRLRGGGPMSGDDPMAGGDPMAAGGGPMARLRSQSQSSSSDEEEETSSEEEFCYSKKSRRVAELQWLCQMHPPLPSLYTVVSLANCYATLGLRVHSTDPAASRLAELHRALLGFLDQGFSAPVLVTEWFQDFYPKLFTVPKPKRGFNLILDFKALNAFNYAQTFCMKSTKSAINSLHQILMMDVKLLGWEAVLGTLTVWWTYSEEERHFLITILELWAICILLRVRVSTFLGTNLPSCFTVASIYGVAVETQAMRHMVISESVICTMLEATSSSSDEEEETSSEEEFCYSKKSRRVAVGTSALLRLISLQNADGSWNLTPEFSAVLGIYETNIKARNPNQNVEVSVWVTVLAVIWLHATNLDQREEWELLEGKAFSWVRARAGSSLGEFVRAGNELLKSSVNPKVFGL